MILWITAVAATGGWVWGVAAMKVVRIAFDTYGWTALNYRGERIPLGYGLLLLPVFVVGAVWLADGPETGGLAVGLLASAGMGLAGWLDDRRGTGEARGLRGHAAALLRDGVVTTGVIKAFASFSLALLTVGFRSVSLLEMAADMLLIMLSTNVINLLDLRPGRALKGGLLLCMIPVASGTLSSSGLAVLSGMLGSLIAVAPDDLRGRAMLGDTGANALGFFGGMLCVYSLGGSMKIGLLLLFIALHLYAERGSITVYIEKNRLLRRLDEWGRG